MTLSLVIILVLSGIGALSNNENRYASSIVFSVTLLSLTTLIVTGHIEL